MIVPRSRLLFWVAIVVLPFALLGAVAPSLTGAALCFIGALAAIVIMDALGAGARLNFKNPI